MAVTRRSSVVGEAIAAAGGARRDADETSGSWDSLRAPLALSHTLGTALEPARWCTRGFTRMWPCMWPCAKGMKRRRGLVDGGRIDIKIVTEFQRAATYPNTLDSPLNLSLSLLSARPPLPSRHRYAWPAAKLSSCGRGRKGKQLHKVATEISTRRRGGWERVGRGGMSRRRLG